jgi:sigma-B regulation protein RsbU (phosphoserine phosphatase)
MPSTGEGRPFGRQDRPGNSAATPVGAEICTALATRALTNADARRAPREEHSVVRATKWTAAQGVAAAMVLVVALGAWRLTVAAGHASGRTAHWEAVAGGVQADVAVGHVWLEEYLAGDRTISVDRDILGNFDRARARCLALRDGGSSPGETGRVAAVDDPQLRGDVMHLSARLDDLRELTVQRLARRTVAGTPADQRYDARFRAALALAERLPVRIRALSNADENRLKVIETAAIVLLGATLLIAVAVIRAAQRQVERLARDREVVLESAGEGILAIDADRRIRFANATAGVLLGWPSKALAARRIDELIPDDARAAVADSPPFTAGDGTAELLRRDGTRLPIEYTATTAEADGAESASIVVTFRDATARQRRERERDVELAELRAMRATLVPAELPQRADLRVATCFVPAVSGVAGDFFLVTDGPHDTTIVVVGDVSGKGIAAAQCAAFVRTSIATFAPYTNSPSRLLELANSALVERGHDFEMLATAACAVVDTAAETVTWSLAGHPAPFALDHGRPVSVRPGLPLGLEPELRAQETVVPLRPGDGFVLFTDALYEARAGNGATEHFGLGRIGDLVAELPGAEPAEVVETLREAVETFAEGHLADDLCILAFRTPTIRASAPGWRLHLPGRASAGRTGR